MGRRREVLLHLRHEVRALRRGAGAAQADPERCGDLIVRVAGFVAYFTMLSPEMQEEIIARTEQEV